MALRTLCPVISNLSQHALTTFQSGIISPSSSISPVCPHLSCRSPDWFHSNTLLSSCLAPAFLSFPGLPLNLYLPCAASHTVHHSLFSPTPVALAQTVVSYDLSVCTCVSQWGYFTMLMNSFQGKFSSVSQSCFVREMCVYVDVSVFPFHKIQQLCIQSTRRPPRVFTERKKERENHSNSFPSTLTSSWDPEERLRALRPHESCLSYCCGRWRDGLMKH